MFKFGDAHLLGDVVELLRLGLEVVCIVALARSDALQIHLHRSPSLGAFDKNIFRSKILISIDPWAQGLSSSHGMQLMLRSVKNGRLSSSGKDDPR